MGELTRFNLPGADASVLNRVLGADPSSILGTLSSNGQVYLINPNGILVGPSARIDTAAFIASTLDIPDQQFLDGGDMMFEGSSIAGITNEGTINASDGDILIFAREVKNTGTLNAPNGTVGLAAGRQILLVSSGDTRIAVAPSLGDAAGTGVDNAGVINALSAELKAAGGLYGLAVNNTGVVNATSVVSEGGRIYHRAEGGTVVNSGTLDASGTTGGRIEVTGDRVGLLDGSVVDASGPAGGGTVLIGGDYLGDNPQVYVAQAVAMGPDAVIRADATEAGDGGRVILWCEDVTRFYGSISARGGSESGDGGFVETSSHGILESRGRVNASSPTGQPGTWLLDPFNVVVNALLTTNGTFSGGNPNVFTPNSDDATVLNEDIDAATGSGTSVTIRTSGGGGAQAGDITINAAIRGDNTGPGSPVTLAFIADQDILLNASIGAGADPMGLIVNPQAGRDVLISGAGAEPDGSVFARDILVDSGRDVVNNGILQAEDLDSLLITADRDLSGSGEFTSNGLLSLVAGDDLVTGEVDILGTIRADRVQSSAMDDISLSAGFNRIRELGTFTSFNGSIFIRDQGDADGLSLTSDVTAATSVTLITNGAIFDDLNPAVSTVRAARLSLQPGTDIGSLPNDLNTSVDNLEAITPAGGVFVNNTAKVLTIGGADPLLSGVQVGTIIGTEIRITNDRSIMINSPVDGERVTARQNITLIATVATSDIFIVSPGTVNSPFAVRSHEDGVVLDAGRDILLGDANGNRGSVRSVNALFLGAGRSFFGDAGSLIQVDGLAGNDTRTVNAGADILLRQSSGVQGARFQTNSTQIRLTTGPLGTIGLDSGATGGVLTVLSGAGDDVFLQSDLMELLSPVNAGVGVVAITQADPDQDVLLGPIGAYGDLALSEEELNRITASTVEVGGLLNGGEIRVTNPVSLGGSFATLTLRTGDDVELPSSLNMGNGDLNVSTGLGINGAGDVTANNLDLRTFFGVIGLDGTVDANRLTGLAPFGASFDSPNNQIDAIGGFEFGISLSVRDMGGLTVNGIIDSPDGIDTPANGTVTLRTVGDFTLDGGGRILNTGGGNNVVIEANTGHFVNQRGADAIQTAARILVYAQNDGPPHNVNGLVFTGQQFGVVFPADPIGVGNVLYFAGAEGEGQVAPLPQVTSNRFAAVTSEDPTIFGFTREEWEDAFEAQLGFRPLRNVAWGDQLRYVQRWKELTDEALTRAELEDIVWSTADGLVYSEDAVQKAAFKKLYGFRPIDGMDLDDQFAYADGFKRAKGPDCDRNMMIAIRNASHQYGINFTPGQINWLSTENKWALVALGGGGEYLDANGNYRHSGGGELNAEQIEEMSKAGPLLTREVDGFIHVEGLFAETQSLKASVAQAAHQQRMAAFAGKIGRSLTPGEYSTLSTGVHACAFSTSQIAELTEAAVWHVDGDRVRLRPGGGAAQGHADDDRHPRGGP